MSDETPSPDPWLDELLASDRSIPELAPAQSERLLSRVQGSIAGLEFASQPDDGAGGLDAATTTAAAAPTLLASKLPVALAALLGLGVGGVGGYATHAITHPPAPERVVTRTVTVPIRASAAPNAPATPALPPPAAPSASPPVKAFASGTTRPAPSAAPAPASASASAPSSPDAALASENALISRAQSALARGRGAEALAATDEHRRLFPGGRFAEEREALAIQAMVQLGQKDVARARAERFLTRYPKSLLSRVVRKAVGLP